MKEYEAMISEANQKVLDEWVRITPRDYTPCLWFNVDSHELWIEPHESREPIWGDYFVLDYFESLDLEQHSVLLLTIESKLEEAYAQNDAHNAMFT